MSIEYLIIQESQTEDGLKWKAETCSFSLSLKYRLDIYFILVQ